MLSKDEREGYKRWDRQALAVAELSDAEIDAISRAEAPAEAAQYDHELTEERSAAGQREALSQ